MLTKLNRIGYAGFAWLIIGSWYVSLFPGRMGFDYSLLISMIREGESTDWWTGLFYWYMRILSFNGNSIFLCSLVGLLALSHAVRVFTKTLPTTTAIQDRVFFFVSLIPLFPVFGLTVSHDVFQTSGIILLFAREVAVYRKIYIRGLSSMPVAALCCVELLTTRTGIYLILLYLVIKAIQKKWLEIPILVLTSLIVMFVSSLGVTHVDSKAALARVLVSDLKCVAQHPEAEISQDEWQFLLSISPEEQWRTPSSCASADAQLSTMDLSENAVANVDFLKKYFSIVKKNPAIVVVAHLQKSRGALPPPFFQGPENQVDLDTRNPIGLNTNTALQSGPEILHPSIDAPGLKVNNGLLKLAEAAAQGPILLINQASWFWGWGGLWLWPILMYALIYLRIRKWRYFLQILSPLLLHHVTMVAIGPGAFGRYYMSAIIMGITTTIYFIVQRLSANE